MGELYNQQYSPEAPSVFDVEGPHLPPASNGQRLVHYIVDMIVGYGLAFGFFAVLSYLIPAFGYWAGSLGDDIGGKLIDRLMTAIVGFAK